mmetsp:Transcript_55460/g.129851  ORF Transcript_55460/g.129851 Transcript_55460/m.129851 type:complete len:218 (+) Transcript_55460:59-712(+)
MSRSTVVAAAALVATVGGLAFVAPQVSSARSGAPVATLGAAPTSSSSSSAQWCCGVAAGLALGAHVGLVFATRGRTMRRAEAPAKYTESAQDAKLFETVFSTYTAEYLKGPMYETPEKMIGRRPFNPGEPLWGEDKKLTSNVLGPLKRVSSNELAFITMICLAIGAWGEAQFLWFDPQFAAIDRGEYFNPIYIIAASLLPVSFWAHIACYIQKANGK